MPVTKKRRPSSSSATPVLIAESAPPETASAHVPKPPSSQTTAPRVAKSPRVAKAVQKAKTAKAPKKRAVRGAVKSVAPRKPRGGKQPATPDTAAQPTPIKDMAPALPPTMPPSTPLPRAAAITRWRKNGPIDVLAYWVRRSARSLLARFKRRAATKAPSVPLPTSPAIPLANAELEALRAENAALRQRIDQLLDSRLERIKDG